MSYRTLTLSWPAARVARIRLTRESEMNTLSLELLEDLSRVEKRAPVFEPREQS